MFARVISAQAADDGAEEVIRLANQQLPDAQRQPGFAGFLLLVDSSAGSVITISLWETRDAMEAIAHGAADGVHDEGVSEAGLTSLRLETYEVAVRV